jgi:hypothetical protein
MLWFVTKNCEYAWHVGEPIPLLNLSELREIQADGDEALAIDPALQRFGKSYHWTNIHEVRIIYSRLYDKEKNNDRIETPPHDSKE